MKFKCVDNKNGALDLTIGKIYEGEITGFEIYPITIYKNDYGLSQPYAQERFEVVDEKPIMKNSTLNKSELELKGGLSSEGYCSYSKSLQDIASYYLKDNELIKNRGDKFISLEHEIKHFNNVVVEQNGYIEIYCTQFRAEHYRSIINRLSNNIKSKITLHVNMKEDL